MLFILKFKINIKNLYLGYQNFQKGDHVEYLCGNNVDCIFIRNIKLFKEFKPKIEQLKMEKSKNF